MKASKTILSFYPCYPARKYLKGKSITQAWNDCPYGAWMLWILERLKPPTTGTWGNTDEYMKAKRAYRDRSIDGTPAERIRSVLSARQVIKLIRISDLRQ